MKVISKVMAFLNKGRTEFIHRHCKYSYRKNLCMWAHSWACAIKDYSPSILNLKSWFKKGRRPTHFRAYWTYITPNKVLNLCLRQELSYKWSFSVVKMTGRNTSSHVHLFPHTRNEKGTLKLHNLGASSVRCLHGLVADKFMKRTMEENLPYYSANKILRHPHILVL